MGYTRDQLTKGGKSSRRGYVAAKKAAKKAATRRLRRWAKSADTGQKPPGWDGYFH